jgi:hypothetical protein
MLKGRLKCFGPFGALQKSRATFKLDHKAPYSPTESSLNHSLHGETFRNLLKINKKNKKNRPPTLPTVLYVQFN